MKLNNRTKNILILLLFLGLFTGTLAWSVFERVLGLFDIDFTMQLGPLGFDISIVQFYIQMNPGTLLGLLSGLFIFKKLK